MPVHHAARPTGRPHVPDETYVVRYVDDEIRPLYPVRSRALVHALRLRPACASIARRWRRTGRFEVSVRVANVGERAGTETVQLYIGDPVASVSRPVRELRGFERLALEPGESRIARFEIDVRDLAFPELAWPANDPRRVAEAGEFTVRVGPSSAEGLEGRFRLAQDWREED